MSAFSAVADDGGARLSWRTASETGNSGFYVEHRGGPAPATFRRLGFVEGEGTTQRPQTYSYRAENLAPGTHAFRLRQVDTDGTETVTDPVSVRITPDEPLSLSPPSPNPVRNETTATLSTQNTTTVTVALYDALGRRVRILHDGRVTKAESRSVEVSTKGLSSGLYFIRATDGARSVTHKLTVVR
jgi:hypothetical protein